MPLAGEAAGIGAALLWSFGGLVCARAGQRVGSNVINELRLFLALPLLFGVHALLFGSLLPAGAVWDSTLWLSLSGVAGLALGDMCYFHCMTVLGPRIGALLMAAAPAMTAVLAVFVLGEGLSGQQIAGIAVTTLGIGMVLADGKGRREWDAEIPKRTQLFAITTGILAAVGQATGNVFSKLGAFAGEVELPPLSSLLLRMIAATLALALVSAFSGRIGRSVRALGMPEIRRALCVILITGPTLGLWCYQFSLQRIDAAVAAILVSLVPIFMIPIARIAYRARPSGLAILGTFVAFGGTLLLLLPQEGA